MYQDKKIKFLTLFYHPRNYYINSNALQTTHAQRGTVTSQEL